MEAVGAMKPAHSIRKPDYHTAGGEPNHSPTGTGEHRFVFDKTDPPLRGFFI